MIFIAAKNDFPWSWPKEIFCSSQVLEVRFSTSPGARVTHTYKPSVRQIVWTCGGLFQFGAIQREESPREKSWKSSPSLRGPRSAPHCVPESQASHSLKGSFWRQRGLWSLAAWRKGFMSGSPHVPATREKVEAALRWASPQPRLCPLGRTGKPVGQRPSHRVTVCHLFFFFLPVIVYWVFILH